MTVARLLRANNKGEGFRHDGGDVYVSWCVGHLFEQAPPGDYGAQYDKWSLDSLPIVPDAWKRVLPKFKAKQFKVLKSLIKKASTVYISTDYDREGENIARDVLDEVGFKGRLLRVRLTAMDDDSVRDALNDVREGYESAPLGLSGEGRRKADWLIGMNFTRLYTVISEQVGAKEVRGNRCGLGFHGAPTRHPFARRCKRCNQKLLFSSFPSTPLAHRWSHCLWSCCEQSIGLHPT